MECENGFEGVLDILHFLNRSGFAEEVVAKGDDRRKRGPKGAMRKDGSAEAGRRGSGGGLFVDILYEVT